MILTPKNWHEFQHYKDRAPPWIKLHKGLLDNYEFSRLPVASRALAPFLWLLASEYDDGKIIATLEELAFRLRMLPNEVADALNPLVQSGFFDCASNALAGREQDACLETETETEVETEKNIAHSRESDWPTGWFDQFWAQYPRRVEKKKTRAILDRLWKSRELSWPVLIGGVMRYAASVANSDPRFTKQPPSWLNAGCWDDEPQPHFNGSPNGNPGNVVAAADRILERLADFDQPAPSDLRNGAGALVIRSIPEG